MKKIIALLIVAGFIAYSANAATMGAKQVIVDRAELINSI